MDAWPPEMLQLFMETFSADVQQQLQGLLGAPLWGQIGTRMDPLEWTGSLTSLNDEGEK